MQRYSSRRPGYSAKTTHQSHLSYFALASKVSMDVGSCGWVRGSGYTNLYREKVSSGRRYYRTQMDTHKIMLDALAKTAQIQMLIPDSLGQYCPDYSILKTVAGNTRPTLHSQILHHRRTERSKFTKEDGKHEPPFPGRLSYTCFVPSSYQATTSWCAIECIYFT